MYPAYQYDNLDYDNAIKKQEIALLEKKYCNTQEMQLNMASAEQMASSGQLQSLLVFNYGVMNEIKLALTQVINLGAHFDPNPGNSLFNATTRILGHQTTSETKRMMDISQRILAELNKLIQSSANLSSFSQQFVQYMNQLPRQEVLQIQTMVQQSSNLYASIQDVEFKKAINALVTHHDLKSTAKQIATMNSEVLDKVMKLYPYLMDAISKYSPMVTNVRAGTVNSSKPGSLPQVNSNSYTLDRGHVAGLH